MRSSVDLPHHGKIGNELIKRIYGTLDESAQSIVRVFCCLLLLMSFASAHKNVSSQGNREIMTPGASLSSETPQIDPRMFITWMDGFDGDHLADGKWLLNTNHSRFKKIVSIVDYALSKSVFVIINSHHEFSG